MVTSNRTEFARLRLQIERDLLVQTQIQTMLANAATTLSRHRLELRDLKAQLRRIEGPHPV